MGRDHADKSHACQHDAEEGDEGKIAGWLCSYFIFHYVHK